MQEDINQTNVNVLSFMHPETGKDYYTPECDVIFRNIFSKSENTKLPQVFAEGILENEIGEITVNVNRDFQVDSVKDKEMEADVKAISKKDGSIYIFEMQTSVPKGITKRFSVYASSACKNTIEKGMPYEKIPPLTLVIIMTKNIPKFKNVKTYHSVWNGREKVFKDEIFEENITIHVIELPKYIEHKKKTNEINIWLEFIIDPLGKAVKEAMRTKEELRLAVDMLNLLNSDEQVRDIALKEMFDEMDRVSAIAEGREEGREQGREEGREEGRKEGREQGIEQGKIQLIKEMIENGATAQQIAKMLKVDVKEIEKMLISN